MTKGSSSHSAFSSHSHPKRPFTAAALLLLFIVIPFVYVRRGKIVSLFPLIPLFCRHFLQINNGEFSIIVKKETYTVLLVFEGTEETACFLDL